MVRAIDDGHRTAVGTETCTPRRAMSGWYPFVQVIGAWIRLHYRQHPVDHGATISALRG